MDEWQPVLALPNLDMLGTIECPYAAIVSSVDRRVEKLRKEHPNITTFLSKFSGQFGERVAPNKPRQLSLSPNKQRANKHLVG